MLAIGKPGFRVAQTDSASLIYGYACGLDMTRRDLQLTARDKGRPWDLGKDVEHSSVVSDIVAMPGQVIDKGAEGRGFNLGLGLLVHVLTSSLGNPFGESRR